MHDPYRMIFVNIIASFVLGIGLLIYYYVYPKKKINLLVLLLLISLLPVINIFRPGDYESGDFNIHIYRTIQFFNLLKEGNSMPSWAGDLNATYGYPLFIFLNPLPYYVQSFFHFIGFSFINSMKILLAISYISSGIFFYLWAKKEIKNSFAAFAGAIVYLFTPYHLVDLHFRVALGETIFFAFLPFFFYAVKRFSEDKNLPWYITSAFAYSLLLFSHQAMAVFAFILILPYFVLLSMKNKHVIRNILIFLSTVALGFIFSAYSWIPHLYYPKFTLAYVLSNQIVVFPQFQELLYSPWRFGFLFQGPHGQLGYLIGYTQLLVILTALVVVTIKRVKKDLRYSLFFWVAITSFLIFMMTPLSVGIWKSVPILNTAQFSTRLLLLVTFSVSVITSYLVIYFKKYPLIIVIFLLVTIGYTGLNWGHRKVIAEKNDQSLITNLAKSTIEIEGFCCMAEPKWTLPTRGFKSIIPQNHVEIIKGKGEIRQIHRTNTKHTYISFSNEKLLVRENTWYFPGWKLLIDNKPTQLTYTTDKEAGIMIFTIPSGLHKIELTYQDLPILGISKQISLVVILFSLFLLVAFRYKKFQERVNDILHLLLRYSNKKRKRKN